MKNKAKSECIRVRGTLQDLHDAGEKPRESAAEHLLNCHECAAFEAFLEGLPRNLRDTLEEAAVRLPAPDYARPIANASARAAPGHLRRFALAATAAAFLALAVPASILIVSAVREKAAMQQAVTTFVNDLFRSSSDARAEYHREGSSASGEALDSLLDDLASD